MYNILFTKKSESQLDKLDNSMRERIISSLERIRVRPENFIEKLVGEPGYKFRVGDYRLILDVDNNNLVILVIELGHRRNIYKK